MGSRKRFERIRPLLVCPSCRGELVFEADHASCSPCAACYPVVDHQIRFVESPPRDDSFDALKERLRGVFGQYYYTVGMTLFSPGLPLSRPGLLRDHFDTANQIVLDCGAGGYRMDERVICVDFGAYPTVDVVCDLTRLPFREGCIDGFLSFGVLEHVPDVATAVAEIDRVARPGARGVHAVPFLFPFHASPHDYHRWTPEGLRRLFAPWEAETLGPTQGPVSWFLTGLYEALSLLFSFGSDRLRSALYLALCLLLFPLKYLDLLFLRNDRFRSMAPILLAVVRKPF